MIIPLFYIIIRSIDHGTIILDRDGKIVHFILGCGNDTDYITSSHGGGTS